MTDTDTTKIEWPKGNRQFVAYGEATRQTVPEGSGKTYTVRPQVWVEYYEAIRVNKVIPGGRNAPKEGEEVRTVLIEFDPESVDLRESIRGYISPNDPQLPALEEAAETGRLISIAIEKGRRKKTKKDKQPISSLTPIHALRGKNRNNGNTPDSMSKSGENIRMALAMVDYKTTSEITSNPAEWAMLADNKSGDVAPEGWRVPVEVMDPDDWTKIGIIVRDEDAPTPAAGGAPANTKALVSEIVAGVVNQLNTDAANTPGKPLVKGKFREGMPWDTRTSNGLVNLGGYLPAKERATFEWAHQHLAHLLDGRAPTTQEAWDLADRLLALSDTVQAATYGHDIQADRTVKSHYEAAMWVRWVVEQEGYPLEGNQDDMAAWMDTVATAATDLFAAAARRVGTYLEEQGRRQRQAATKSGPSSDAKTDEGADSTTVLSSALNAALKFNAAGNADHVKNVALQLVARDLHNSMVAVRRDDQGNPVAVPASTVDDADKDRWTPLTANDFLLALYKQLTKDAGSTKDAAPTEDTASAGEPAAPADEGYSAPLAGVIDSIRAATDMTSLRAAYYQARDGSLLHEEVRVRSAADGSVQFGAPGEAGYAVVTLSEVLDRIRQRFVKTDTASSAPSGEEGDEMSAQAIADHAVEAARVDDQGELNNWHAVADSQNLLSETIKTSDGLTGTLENLFAQLRK